MEEGAYGLGLEEYFCESAQNDSRPYKILTMGWGRRGIETTYLLLYANNKIDLFFPRLLGFPVTRASSSCYGVPQCYATGKVGKGTGPGVQLLFFPYLFLASKLAALV